MEITPELLRKVLEEIRADYQREEDQAILQQNMYKAAHALAGKEACARIQNRLAIVAAMGEPAARATPLRKRA